MRLRRPVLAVLPAVATLAAGILVAPANVVEAPERTTSLLRPPVVPTGATRHMLRQLATRPPLPASVQPYTRAAVSYRSFPTMGPAGQAGPPARWRIVENTGNCCENYLSSTPDGTLLDFGGNWLRLSSDEGQTWQEVRPDVPITGGEGAVAVAPDGDILGVAWDPWGGDWLTPFKYDAQQDVWLYSVTKAHVPFFDRPTIAVFPRSTAPDDGESYIAGIRGGLYETRTRNLWMFSGDGLHYDRPSSRFAEQAVREPVQKWLDVTPLPEADWLQPHEQAGVTFVAPGESIHGLSANRDTIDRQTPRFTILDSDTLTWSRFEFKSGILPGPGRLYSDSRGRLHYLVAQTRRVVYMMSSDGGRHWSRTTNALPEGYSHPRDHWVSFRVNAAAGVAGLVMHADGERGNQDLLFSYDVTGNRPRLTRIFFVGNGDLTTYIGLNSPGERFDFSTLTLLPDGRAAVSFADSTGPDPMIAIQLDKPARGDR